MFLKNINIFFLNISLYIYVHKSAKFVINKSEGENDLFHATQVCRGK